MLRKLIASGSAMALLFNTYAQDSTNSPALNIGGSVDVYYRFDLQKTRANNLTSFTNSHNTIELGMATVKLDYSTSKVQMVADLGFGKRAKEFSYNDEGMLAAIKQLYISYSPASWLKLTAGSWATHIGYELVDAGANRNYSMSYMFTNGPFSHTGVKADLIWGSHGFMVGISNPTDFKYVPDGFINNKFLLAQYSYVSGDQLKFYLNYAGGEGTDTSKTRQYDLVVISKLSEKTGLGFCGTVNDIKKYLGNKNYDENRNWWSTAVYLNYDPSEKLAFTLREEYFSDRNGLKIAGLSQGGSIFSSTLSAIFRIDKLMLIPEFRFDRSDKTIFTGSKGTPVQSAASILVAAIYHF